MTLFKDVFVVSGSGVGGGSLGYANTLYRARPAFFDDPQWAGLGDWEPSSRPTTTPPSGCSASPSTRAMGPADQLLQEYGEEIGVGDTFTNTRVGVFFGEPGKTGPRPLLRRRGTGPDRLPALRQLHGRLPPRRQEHAGQELPLVRREARGRDPARTPGDRDPPARRRRRLRRLRGHQRALRRLAPPRAPRRSPPAAWSSPPAPSAPTSCSPTASTAARCRGSPTGSARVVRTNSESIQAVTAPDDEPRLQPLGGDHLQHLPRPRHPHRGRHLRRGRRRDERHLHG